MRVRILLLVATAAVLALPAGALAERGTERSAVTTLAAKKAAKAKKAKKAKRARLLALERARARARAASLAKGPDEREFEGRVASLSPLTVVSDRTAARALTCDVPSGVTVGTLAVGDRVEITCDLVGGRWVLRTLEREGAEHAKGPGPATGGTGSCDDDSGKLDDEDEDDEDDESDADDDDEEDEDDDD